MSNENFKEFVANKEIKMTFANEPGVREFLTQWSLSVPTLFLLDICVVSATKLDRKSLNDEDNKAKYIDYLKNNDLEHNCFSYICALMERVSDSRELMTPEQIKEQLIVDINALRNFFKNARVYENDEYILNFADELLGKPIELNRNDLLNFLNEINVELKLYNTVAQNLRLDKAKQIIQVAQKLGISTQHPIVLTTLAALYGNPSAKKLMKFKENPEKFQAENALADIMLISRCAKIKLEIESISAYQNFGYPRVNFVTADIGLNELVKCFKPQSVQHRDYEFGSETKFTFNVNLEKLLTEAESSTLDILSELLLKDELAES